MTKRNHSRYLVAVMAALVAMTLHPVTTSAQSRGIEITPTYSYMWAGSFETLSGTIYLQDGSQYGGIVDVPVNRTSAGTMMVELSYAYLSSTATYAPYVIGKPGSLDGLNMDVSVQYFQLGAIQELDKGKTKPFMGLAMGAVLFHPKQAAYNGLSTQDLWRFAVSATAGLKIAFSESVALRLQGRLFLPLYFTGGGIFVGTGGVSAGASAAIPIVQGDVGVGLAITI